MLDNNEDWDDFEPLYQNLTSDQKDAIVSWADRGIQVNIDRHNLLSNPAFNAGYLGMPYRIAFSMINEKSTFTIHRNDKISRMMKFNNYDLWTVVKHEHWKTYILPILYIAWYKISHAKSD